MDGVNVLRNRTASIGPMFYFLVVLLLFVGHIFSGPTSERVLSAAMVAVSLFGIFRGSRAGYLEVSRDKVIVRTFFRTKVIERDSIESVEPVEVAQATLRVFPVIILKDGRRYRVSEFFSQRRSYRKKTEQSIVTKVIQAIDDSRFR